MKKQWWTVSVYMLFGVFELNGIKFFSYLCRVIANIAGDQGNCIKERFFWNIFHINQYDKYSIITPATLFYYYEIICAGVNYKL